MVSSSDGCSWTMWAHRAPPNPPAPSTATRWSGTQPPSDLRQRGLDRRAALGHLGVGERPVGGLERKPPRQRLLALAGLLAPIDVEQLERRQQRAAALADRRLDV